MKTRIYNQYQPVQQNLIFCLDCSTLQAQLNAIKACIAKVKVLLENCQDISRPYSNIQSFVINSLNFWTLRESEVQMKITALESSCGVLTTKSADQPNSGSSLATDKRK